LTANLTIVDGKVDGKFAGAVDELFDARFDANYLFVCNAAFDAPLTDILMQKKKILFAMTLVRPRRDVDAALPRQQ
jgi:hypothetical protein